MQGRVGLALAALCRHFALRPARVVVGRPASAACPQVLEKERPGWEPCARGVHRDGPGPVDVGWVGHECRTFDTVLLAAEGAWIVQLLGLRRCRRGWNRWLESRASHAHDASWSDSYSRRHSGECAAQSGRATARHVAYPKADRPGLGPNLSGPHPRRCIPSSAIRSRAHTHKHSVAILAQIFRCSGWRPRGSSVGHTGWLGHARSCSWLEGGTAAPAVLLAGGAARSRPGPRRCLAC